MSCAVPRLRNQTPRSFRVWRRSEEGKGYRRQMFRAYGRFYGYPDCCVESFVTQPASMRTTEQTSVARHYGFGFVPCPDHAHQVARGAVTYRALIKNESRGVRAPLVRSPTGLLHYIRCRHVRRFLDKWHGDHNTALPEAKAGQERMCQDCRPGAKLAILKHQLYCQDRCLENILSRRGPVAPLK
jgi:hypothetical protein